MVGMSVYFILSAYLDPSAVSKRDHWFFDNTKVSRFHSVRQDIVLFYCFDGPSAL